MKDKIKEIASTIIERWKSKMPQFFKWIMGINAALAAIAVAVQTALTAGGAIAPSWWETIYPYIIGINAGMIAASKFTQKH